MKCSSHVMLLVQILMDSLHRKRSRGAALTSSQSKPEVQERSILLFTNSLARFSLSLEYGQLTKNLHMLSLKSKY